MERSIARGVAPYITVATLAAVAATMFVALNAFAEALAVAPDGTDGLMLLMVFPFFGLALAFLFVPVGLILLVFRSTRYVASLGLVGCVVLVVMSLLLQRNFVGSIRTDGFRRASASAAPVISAIERYEGDNGQPPSALSVLVPSYLPSLPGTGIAAYPKFEYEATPNTPQSHFGNAWVLWVETPSGGINWDIFLYLPNQRYPRHGYGGDLERVGRWAYVHE